jgi:two-component system, chemotaxis family, chemotaxis protein CheY
MARLLVIDDDPYIRELVPRLAYKRVGNALEVLHAVDLGEALAICAAKPIALVLSDYFMPECDGPELLHRLRQRFPAVRAVLMTGDAAKVGQSLPEACVPVRDKADLDAVVREAVDLALEGL